MEVDVARFPQAEETLGAEDAGGEGGQGRVQASAVERTVGVEESLVEADVGLDRRRFGLVSGIGGARAIEDEPGRHPGVRGANDLRPWGERAEAVADPGDVVGPEEIDLVRQDQVGGGELAGLEVGTDEVVRHRAGVDQGDDVVEAGARKRADDVGERPGIGDAARLQQDDVGAPRAVEEVEQGAGRAAGLRAAGAAIAERQGIPMDGGDQARVDVERGHVVHQRGDAPAPGGREQMAQKGGLAGAEETGDDDDGKGRAYAGPAAAGERVGLHRAQQELQRVVGPGLGLGPGGRRDLSHRWGRFCRRAWCPRPGCP